MGYLNARTTILKCQMEASKFGSQELLASSNLVRFAILEKIANEVVVVENFLEYFEIVA